MTFESVPAAPAEWTGGDLLVEVRFHALEAAAGFALPPTLAAA
jgi:hypothetical protein